MWVLDVRYQCERFLVVCQLHDELEVIAEMTCEEPVGAVDDPVVVPTGDSTLG